MNSIVSSLKPDLPRDKDGAVDIDGDGKAGLNFNSLVTRGVPVWAVIVAGVALFKIVKK